MAGYDPERLLDQFLASTSSIVEIADAQGRLLHVNPRFCELTGYTAQEARGHTPAELLRSDLHDSAFYEAMWSTVCDGRPWHGELISRNKDGSLCHCIATVFPVHDPSGAIANLVAIKDPIAPPDETSTPSETLAGALARLRASEQRYRAMVSAAGDAIMVADFETALLVDANPAARVLFGYSVAEFRQLTVRALTSPDGQRALDRLAADLVGEGDARSSRLQMTRKDGTRFWTALRMSTYALGGQRLYVINLRDVSDEVEREAELARSNEQLRAAQERLRQTERMAALGQLSAAVAHEINNPLQFIDINLKELQRTLPQAQLTDDQRSMLEDLHEGFERIANTTRDLASFTRIERDKVGPLDFDDVVRRACGLLKNELRHRAQLDVKLSTTRTLAGERSKLIAMVTHLLLNAAHAIDEGHADLNLIRVRTKERGDTLLLTVEDSGTGIPPELHERIFEPFFTTKPAGRGSGLGLSVCAETVRLHQGTITLRSQPGHGSRFEIRLPFDNGLLPPSAEASAGPEGTRGRVLLIDDDPLVLRGLRRVLAGHHEVVIAEGGERALELLAEDQRFDVVVCDLMMPVADGPAIHEAVVSGPSPQLARRMLFCSGGAFTPRSRGFIESVGNRMLKKPVRADALLGAIEALMASHAQGGV